MELQASHMSDKVSVHDYTTGKILGIKKSVPLLELQGENHC